MPTYEYACKSCGQHLEVVQSFKDSALTECPLCEGPLRKVFGNIGIAFKGSGFYKTDSRSDRKSSSAGTEAKPAAAGGAATGGAATGGAAGGEAAAAPKTGAPKTGAPASSAPAAGSSQPASAPSSVAAAS